MDTLNGYRLTLSHFKGVENLSIDFPTVGVILLDGRSGVGKTTLLDAISFALYDGAKNSCYPRTERNSRKKSSTSVHLAFSTQNNLPLLNGLEIYRQRRPNLLSVKGKNISLMDDSAQQFLNQVFGPISSWLAGGYLKQYDFCAFLSMSSQDKLSFLQELSLPDSFEMLLNKSSEKLQTAQKDLLKASNDVRLYHEMYLRIYQQCSPETINSSIWDKSQLESYLDKYNVHPDPNSTTLSKLHLLLPKAQSYFQTQLGQKQIDLTQAQVELTKVQEAAKQRQILTTRLAELKQKLAGYFEDYSKLDEYLSSNTDEISKYESEIERLTEQISWAQNSERRSQLLAAKSEIQRRSQLINTEQSKYTLNELAHFEKILSGPNLDELDNRLTYIQTVKDYLKLQSEYQHRQNLVSEKLSLEEKLKTYPEKSVAEDIDKITQKIWSAELHRKKLTCPQCSAEVYLNNHKLEQCPTLDKEINLSQLATEKQRLQEMDKLFRERIQLDKVYQDLILKLNDLPEVEMVDSSQFQKCVNNLNLSQQNLNASYLTQMEIQINSQRKSRSEIPEIDNSQVLVEKQKIENWSEKSRLDRDINLINQELKRLEIHPEDENLPKLDQELEGIRNQKKQELTRLRQKITEVRSIGVQIDQIQGQLAQITEESPDKSQVNLIQTQFYELEKEANLFLKETNTQIKLVELVDLYQKHDYSVQIEKSLNEKITCYQKIRSTLITAEYVILDSILSQINLVIGEILAILFLEPITITLRSLRQLKANDRIKPEINLEIVYKGAEFTSLNELSGGEKSRVSLALVIAFSRLNKAPFLLLDESLSSLDVITKESAISAIKLYLNEKLIIAVNHDTTEGVYDSVIRLS